LALRLQAEEERTERQRRSDDAASLSAAIAINAAETARAAASRATRVATETAAAAAVPTTTPGIALSVTHFVRERVAFNRRAFDASGCGACVNFDHASAFVDKTCAEIAANAARRSRMCVVFHGTSNKNMHSIIDTNLRIPDGRNVLHSHDTGSLGRGIYVSPKIDMPFAFARWFRLRRRCLRWLRRWKPKVSRRRCSFAWRCQVANSSI
jgi:hypothetical protein